MVTSSQVVNAYGARPELTAAGPAGTTKRNPLRDARGFTYSGALYDPAEALRTRTSASPTSILTNGA